MPGRSRSVGAASRHAGSSGGSGGGTPNNSPAFVMWTNIAPASDGAGGPVTEAKLLEWKTQRMVGGGGFAPYGAYLERFALGLNSSPPDYYNDDGSIPMNPTPSPPAVLDRWWYQGPLALKWGATPNTRTFFARCNELGLVNLMVTGTRPTELQDHAFNAVWHDNSAWGASTVAGALTPSAGSVLEDFIRLCKAAYAAGFRGLFFDYETTGKSGFEENYTGKPGAQTAAQTRGYVALRAMQMRTIFETYMPGCEAGAYYDRSTGSWDELQFYITQNGNVNDHILDFVLTDIFGAAWATGTSKWTQLSAEFYRGVQMGNDDVTGQANAHSFNMARRYARQSYVLSTTVLPSGASFTSAEKLASMRNTYRCPFIWLTAGGPPDPEGGPASTALGQVMIREAVRWANGGKFFIYTQQLNDDPNWGGSSAYTKDHNPYEAAMQAECVSAVAQSTSPTVSITHIDGVANPGATSYSTAAASVTVQLTATDDFAIWRGEWANAATGGAGTALTTWVNDSGANWVPLDPSKLPRNTSLGRIQSHVTLLNDIPLAGGVNVLTFPVYNIHGLATTVTLTVTQASIFSLFQSRYPATGAEIWVDGTLGNDGFAGTPAAPKATIQAAINVSVAGSKIMVRPYAPGYATITFAGHSGTASNYIQLIASGATSMFSPGAKINCNGGAGSGSAGVSMIGNNNNFIAMWGFEVTGLNSSSAPYEVGVMPGNGAHDVAVWGCYFHDLASHAVAAPGAGGQGWQGVDRIDVCYNRITHTSRWNPYQGSGISMISQANLGGAWADGYRNHIIGNVIDGVFTDPNAPNLTPNFITDGNSIIFDISGGYAGRTLVAHNVTVGAGGRGIHTLSFNGIDAWFNTSCDSIQNLPGTWVGEFSIQDSSDCHFGWNVGAAKVGSNRVGNFQNPGTSTWSDTVFLRGTGGSEGNDPSVNSFNNINKTQVGPANYFNQYQQGVYQQTVITNVAGFRPKLAQVVTGNPPANIRAAVAPWPDALGVLRPASGPWAYGAFEAA